MKDEVTRQMRRGKKRWVLDWTDRHGQRHQPTFPTKEAAEVEADNIRTSLKAAHGKDPALPDDTTWSALFERAMENRGDLKRRTPESYRENNRLHLAPVFGDFRVRDISRAQCRDFLRTKLKTHSRNTVRLLCATLHVVFEEAAEDGLIPANPVAGLSRKLKLSTKAKARQDAVSKKAMTREERDLFLKTAERIAPWWAPAWTVQVLTGLRPGELYALEEADLDLTGKSPSLRVERALSDDGKSIDTPKCGFGRRVDLSNEAVRTFRATLARRRERKLRLGAGDLPKRLFASHTASHADPTHVRHAFTRVCLAAGLTKVSPKSGKLMARFSPHSLRHSYAALHLQAGTDLYYVSRQLGHADITLTVHTYGAWLQPNRRANLDALDREPSTTTTEHEAHA